MVAYEQKNHPHHERCINCGALTGKAGADEDSIFIGNIGPLCDDCYDSTEHDRLKALVERLVEALSDSCGLLALAQNTHLNDEGAVFQQLTENNQTLAEARRVMEGE